MSQMTNWQRIEKAKEIIDDLSDDHDEAEEALVQLLIVAVESLAVIAESMTSSHNGSLRVVIE